MFTYTALESQLDSDAAIPVGVCLENIHQSVIKFDPDVSILVDLGWNADLSLDLSYLEQEIKNAQLVLLSHATIAHLGAYAYLYHKYAELSQIPVYATAPVIALGKLMTLDMYRSAALVGPFERAQLTVEDIDAAFDHITQLKYHQPISLAAKLTGVVICAFNSGHSLGGTIWKVTKDQESVVYAVEWNHSRDTLHNGSMLSKSGDVYEALTKSNALVSSTNLSVGESLKNRRQTFFDKIMSSIEKKGTVLLPTSNGSRALELGYMLDNYWAENKISVPLYFLSYTGARAVTQASTLIEWMSRTVVSNWESNNRIPFGHSNLVFANSLSDLGTGPKVVLASGENLEIGWSRILFSRLSSDSNTCLILTENPAIGTLADTLYKMYVDKSQDPVTRINVEFWEEDVLQGDELQEYNKQQSEQRRQDELQNAIDMRNRNILEQEEGDSSDEEDEAQDMLQAGKLDVNALAYGQIYDYDLRSDPRGRTRMFPYHVKRKRFDDYGQIIKFEDFSKATEHAEEDVEGTASFFVDQNGSSLLGASRVGEKRKWEDDDHTADQQPAKTSDDALDANDDGTDVDNRGIINANNAALASITAYNQPTSIRKCQQELVINCDISFVDFSGLTDETSIKMLLPKLSSSKLFLVPSRSLEHCDLVESLNTLEQALDVVQPNVPLSTGTNTFSYNVTISPELAKLLRWQKVFGNINVAHVAGRLQISNAPIESESDSADNKVDEHELESEQQLISEKEKQKQIYTLVPLQTIQELAQAPRTTQLYVGDIKLAELKKRLVAEGHRAEFRAEGVLVCDDKVAIRKTAEGRVTLEGGVGKEFYETKKAIRSLLAIV